MKRIIIAIALVLSSQTAHALSDAILITEARIKVLKTRVANKTAPNYGVYVSLKKDVDNRKNDACHATARFEIPACYGDRAGCLAAREGIANDARLAYRAALVYRMTGNEAYAKISSRLLNCWAVTTNSFVKGHGSGLWWSNQFSRMIEAANLIRKSPSFTSQNQTTFKAFVRKSLAANTMSSNNNWGDWGLYFVASAAVYLKDQKLFDSAVSRYKSFIVSQIGTNGEMVKEVHRSGANSGGPDDGLYGMNYSNYALMPLVLVAEIFRTNGVDLYSYAPNGHSLEKAYRVNAHYTLHPESFPYYPNPPEMGLHSIGYVEILNPRFPNADAAGLLKKYRPISGTPGDLTFTHANLLEK